MDLINEKYILLLLEFKENKKSINTILVNLIGNQELSEKINDNIPNEINNEFIEKMKINGVDLDDKDVYLYPLSFSLIKKVIHTYEGVTITTDKKTGEKKERPKWRIVNKSPGIMMLYEYMGSILYFKQFVDIVLQNIKKGMSDNKKTFSNFKSVKIILCSEIDYIDEIINQNYFCVNFQFKSDKNADPNDYRRPLLGITRDHESLENPGKYGIPQLLKEILIDRGSQIEEETVIAYPINFSITKRPIILDKKKNKFSLKASGVMILYQYMGFTTEIETFKDVIKDLFYGNINKYENLLEKSDQPLILVGAELKSYKGFEDK